MATVYRDSTPLTDAQKASLEALATAIRSKKYGKDVREAIAAAIELVGMPGVTSYFTPKGVKDNLAALQTAFPNGTDGIYITKDDGYWCFWDGSSWQKGNVYQASISDDLIKSIADLELSPGYIDKEGNVVIDSRNQYQHTGYIPIGSISAVKIPLWNGMSNVAFYDKKYTFLGYKTGIGDFSQTKELCTDLSSAPSDTQYIRISQIADHPASYTINLSSLIEKTESEIESIFDGENITYSVQEQSLNIDGTFDKYYDQWYSSEFIDIQAYKSLDVFAQGYSSVLSPLAFFDSSKKLIKVFQEADFENVEHYTIGTNSKQYTVKEEVSVPVGAAYAVLGINTDPTKTIWNAYLRGLKSPKLDLANTTLNGKKIADVISSVDSDNRWKGKSIAFLGDSITAGIGTTTTFWQYLENLIGITAKSYGMNGAQYDYALTEAQQLKNDAISVDAIVLFFGTNDFHKNIPLGNWYSEVDTQVQYDSDVDASVKKRSLTSDTSTLRGRINNVISFLKQNFPNKQIIVLTPLHRGYAKFDDSNVQPSQEYSNELNLYISDYVNAIKESADVWSVNMVDLYSLYGVLPESSTFDSYVHDASTDRLHPNALGHQRIAQVLVASLNGITPDLSLT